jgi:hypothetical protein
MPPPPPVGDGPWPQSNIDLFGRWVSEDCLPRGAGGYCGALVSCAQTGNWVAG